KPATFCPNNDCVTFRVEDFLDRLRTKKEGPDSWSRASQLRFLIHFVGDLHQPLHTTTNSDRGGNCVTVTTFRNGNLHKAWDSSVLEGSDTDDIAVSEHHSSRYDKLSSTQKSEMIAGTVSDWAVASHQLAISKPY